MNPEISILGLAYLGDSVYELLVRTFLAENGLLGAHSMHVETVKYVNARAQSEAVDKILPHLTDEEMNVFRRGRNAKVNSVPQKSSVAEYHRATGFEAVFGWLWIKGQRERIYELFSIITEND